MHPWLVACVALAAWWALRLLRRAWRFRDIPGPPALLSLPLVGHGWLLRGDPVAATLRLWRRYGDAFQLDLGGRPTLVLCSGELVREAFSKEAFCGRAWNEVPTVLAGQCPIGEDGVTPVKNVTLSDPPQWAEMRRFMSRNLASQGLGNRDAMGVIIQEEAQQVVGALYRKREQPIRSNGLFLNPVNNVVWRLATGKRQGLDDPHLIELTNTVSKVFKNLDPNNFWSVLHMNSLAMAKLYQKLGWSNYLDNCGAVRSFVRQEVKAAKPDEKGNYIERALHEKARLAERGEQSFLTGSDGIIRIESQLVEMYLAGTESTATFMEWFLLYSLMFPDFQERMHDEIAELTSNNSRAVGLEDKGNAHFTNAMIDEVVRHCPMVLFPTGRKVLNDTRLQGMQVPRGTQVVPCHIAINRHAMVYANPDKFDPERFLVREGDGGLRYQKDNQPFFFGVGKRRCPGELLARAEVFLFATRIVQKFRLRAAQPDSLTMAFNNRLLMSPKPYEFVAEMRTK